MLRGMWGCWSYKNDNFKEDFGPSFQYLIYPEKMYQYKQNHQ